MVLERIVGAFGGRQQLDVEPLEQRARAELGLAQCFVDAVAL